jgi:ABC transporter transmembrane region
LKHQRSHSGLTSHSGLDGAPTIRVFRKETNFVTKFQVAVDQNSSALLNYVTAQRWLGVRIELLGSVVVLVATVLIVCLNDVLSIEPGICKLSRRRISGLSRTGSHSSLKSVY